MTGIGQGAVKGADIALSPAIVVGRDDVERVGERQREEKQLHGVRVCRLTETNRQAAMAVLYPIRGRRHLGGCGKLTTCGENERWKER